MAMIFGFTADNSSGKQALHFSQGKDGSLEITLVGKYGGDIIQIDFDALDAESVDDLIYLLQRYQER